MPIPDNVDVAGILEEIQIVEYFLHPKNCLLLRGKLPFGVEIKSFDHAVSYRVMCENIHGG